MFVVDTNVLLYAADESSEFHAPCRRLLEGLRSEPIPWFLTWGIAYEFLRVVSHPRVYPHPWSASEAYAFVEALLRSPSARLLTPTARHAEVLWPHRSPTSPKHAATSFTTSTPPSSCASTG